MQFFTFALAALSVGSVFTAPSPTVVRRNDLLDAAISAVETAQTAVASEVAIINTALEGTVSLGDVITITTAVTAITADLATAALAVAPLSTVVSLTEEEIESLPGLLSDVNDIVTAVQGVATDLANNPATAGLATLVGAAVTATTSLQTVITNLIASVTD